MGAGMPQLYSDKGSVLVSLLADEREVLAVLLVPEPGRRRHRVPVRLGVDRGDLDADRTPAAVGSRGPEARLRARPVTSEARRVGYLEEAVPDRLRPDAERLEQHVVCGVTSSHPKAYRIAASPVVKVLRMTPESALAAVQARHGQSFALEGRCSGGEVGAYFARAEDGRRLVFKWTDDPAYYDELARVVGRVLRLRAKGFPAPRYHPPLAVDGGVIVFQDAVAGEAYDVVGHALLDVIFDLNDMQAGEADLGQGWTEYLAGTLAEGAEGFCLHDSLRQFSRETKEILGWIESVGEELDPLPCRDLVHFDFHHRNVLRVGGALSAVVDWEGCVPGDRAFDLVTFWFGLTHARPAPPVAARVWERASELCTAEALAAYFAHMALRRLDWTIRHHDSSEVIRVLDFIDDGRRRLG